MIRSRWMRRILGCAVLFPAALAQPALADETTPALLVPAEVVVQPRAAAVTPASMPTLQSAVVSQPVDGLPPSPDVVVAAPGAVAAGTVVAGPVVPGAVVAPGAGYVQLGAALYPSPKPTVPAWVGGTMITNQAFAPHEMLYPHTYRAMYPPFYHKVSGGWVVTPLGVKSHERWELQGTMVQVKYRSHYPLLPHWHPPFTSMDKGPWK